MNYIFLCKIQFFVTATFDQDPDRFGSLDPDPHWDKKLDPEPPLNQCGSTTLLLLQQFFVFYNNELFRWLRRE
jgi:hypothetical protein